MTYLHADEVDASAAAARIVVPLAVEALGAPSSVVDVGGGAGAWLREFANRGAARVLLLDDPTVRPHLLIDPAAFRPVDLERDLPDVGRFDLALCLECAEHLAPGRARPLVRWLTAAADRVVFSAAVPGQGGKRHRNEQWPDYWAARFAEAGYERYDLLRPRILRDQRVAWWYRQNLFVFAHPRAGLRQPEDAPPDDFLLIHRTLTVPGVRGAARTLLDALRRLAGRG